MEEIYAEIVVVPNVYNRTFYTHVLVFESSLSLENLRKYRSANTDIEIDVNNNVIKTIRLVTQVYYGNNSRFL